MQERYVDLPPQVPKPIFLYLNISADESFANTIGTRGLMPVVFSIMNFSGKSYKFHLAGYAPMSYPYSTKRLHELMANDPQKIRGIGDREEVLKRFGSWALSCFFCFVWTKLAFSAHDADVPVCCAAC